MGWGTTLYTSLYFSRETFRTKYEVESALNDAKKMRDLYKDKIKAMVYMTEPNKYYSNEEGDILEQVQNDLDIQFNELDDYNYEIYKLELLLEEWDKCHNKDGKAICPPEDMPYDTCYLHGGFIEMVYPNGTKVKDDI
jgi:hypothetical protein